LNKGKCYPSSFHPPHTKRAVVYSQALRYSRICSNTEYRNTELTKLNKAFSSLGYNQQTVQSEINRAKEIPRENLLTYKDRTKLERIPLVVNYNPTLHKVKKISRELQNVLNEDTVMKGLFPQPPIIAYRQPPNRKRTLVRSRLESDPTDNIGTFPCNKTRCQLCPLVVTKTEIDIPNRTEKFVPSGHFTCDSSNVIYLITCKKCPSTYYIGETGQTLRKRMNGHKCSSKR